MTGQLSQMTHFQKSLITSLKHAFCDPPGITDYAFWLISNQLVKQHVRVALGKLFLNYCGASSWKLFERYITVGHIYIKILKCIHLNQVDRLTFKFKQFILKLKSPYSNQGSSCNKTTGDNTVGFIQICHFKNF